MQESNARIGMRGSRRILMSKVLNDTALQSLIKNALAEDLGSGDATTLATVPENVKVKGVLLAKENCVCAGLVVAQKVFQELDSSVKFKPLVKEGEFCKKGTFLAEIIGDAQAILTAERTALNYLQRISGIASITHKYVEQTKGSKTKILDTRKTTPA